MVDTDRRPTATSWRALLLRVREALTPEAYERAPDYGPDAPDSDREAWLRQLGRVRDLLEETRAVVAAGGLVVEGLVGGRVEDNIVPQL